jgi:hypothetical protein
MDGNIFSPYWHSTFLAIVERSTMITPERLCIILKLLEWHHPNPIGECGTFGFTIAWYSPVTKSGKSVLSRP